MTMVAMKNSLPATPRSKLGLDLHKNPWPHKLVTIWPVRHFPVKVLLLEIVSIDPTYSCHTKNSPIPSVLAKNKKKICLPHLVMWPQKCVKQGTDQKFKRLEQDAHNWLQKPRTYFWGFRRPRICAWPCTPLGKTWESPNLFLMILMFW